MTDLARYTQKVFGESAGFQQIGQFGSFAAGSPIFTTNPETIQALSNYLGGWFDAVIGGNSPAIEDMNGLCYLFAYQLTYLFQKGIAQWDDGTTYYIGALVNRSGIIYRSLEDTNLNNDPASTTAWGAPYSYGQLIPNSIANDLSVLTGTSLVWAKGTVATSKTLTVDSGGAFFNMGDLTINGTLIVNGDFQLI